MSPVQRAMGPSTRLMEPIFNTGRKRANTRSARPITKEVADNTGGVDAVIGFGGRMRHGVQTRKASLTGMGQPRDKLTVSSRDDQTSRHARTTDPRANPRWHE